MSTKKYILKPGKHQFAPGSAAIHDNDNLTDKEAAWYLKAYPHIKVLFVTLPATKRQSVKSLTKSVKSETKSVKSPKKSVESQL